MIRLNPQAFLELCGKNIIAYGTGITAKRYIPYLAQDPDIRLYGITNSRITAEDAGTFLDTGLPLRSLKKWAELLPDATILLMTFTAVEEIIANCKSMGFKSFQFITTKMVSAFADMEAGIAQTHQAEVLGHFCMANELRDAHKASFSEFKSCNRGRTVAVVGTGPSLNYYSQSSGITHIGVSASFLKKNLSLDYYFIAHNVSHWLEKLKEYDFVKFFKVGITNRKTKDQIPEYIIEENGGRRYFSIPLTPFEQIHTNIEYYPVMGCESVIFQAIHFALYTHPKKLLLVGCDCALNGHFKESQQDLSENTRQKPLEDGTIQIPQWIDGYQNVKRFAVIHYPDTEIISVNPVGLKGIFRDVYTESYLDVHPEIARSECELLTEEKEAL